MLSAAGTRLLFWVVCTGPSVPLCLASASSWRHGPSFWWNGEWRVGEIQGLLSLTRACLCGLQSVIAVGRVSLNRVHIFSEVAEVPSCQPGQSWLSLVGPSPPPCTVEWVLAPVSSSVGGWSLRSAQHLGQKVPEGPVFLGWAVGC